MHTLDWGQLLIKNNPLRTLVIPLDFLGAGAIFDGLQLQIPGLIQALNEFFRGLFSFHLDLVDGSFAIISTFIVRTEHVLSSINTFPVTFHELLVKLISFFLQMVELHCGFNLIFFCGHI